VGRGEPFLPFFGKEGGTGKGSVEAGHFSEYLGNPGFPAGRSFMPLFMAFDQVRYEIPAFGVNPEEGLLPGDSAMERMD
jgi:hypothetical protein